MEKFQRKGQELLSLGPHERKLHDLVYQSFRFSQGHIFLQQEIFSWMREKEYLDSLLPLFNSEMPDYISSLMYPKKHKAIVERDREKELLETLEETWPKIRLGALVPSNGELNPEKRVEKLHHSILKRMLDQDTKFQVHKRAGRNEEEKNVPDSSNDPHASFLRRHAVLGRPTGSMEFDSLFSELKPFLWQYKKTEYTPYDHSDGAGLSDKTLTLEMLWEQNHPGHSFFPAV